MLKWVYLCIANTFQVLDKIALALKCNILSKPVFTTFTYAASKTRKCLNVHKFLLKFTCL